MVDKHPEGTAGNRTRRPGAANGKDKAAVEGLTQPYDDERRTSL